MPNPKDPANQANTIVFTVTRRKGKNGKFKRAVVPEPATLQFCKTNAFQHREIFVLVRGRPLTLRLADPDGIFQAAPSEFDLKPGQTVRLLLHRTLGIRRRPEFGDPTERLFARQARLSHGIIVDGTDLHIEC